MVSFRAHSRGRQVLPGRDPGERGPETSCARGHAREIVVDQCGSQPDQLRIDTRQIDLVDRHREPIADPLESREVAADAIGVARGGVDDELAHPELEAGSVDLGRRPVAKLELERGLRDVDRRGRGVYPIASRDCCVEALIAEAISAAILGGTCPER